MPAQDPEHLELPHADAIAEYDYWREARRPMACLAFLLPLLLLYEFGVLYYGGARPEAVRNGADSWMRAWLSRAGLLHEWLPPVLILGGLAAWQLLSRDSWKLSPATIKGMFAESVLFAFVLMFVGQLTNAAFEQSPARVDPSTAGVSAAALAVTFVGAGIYEEVLFRLGLLPLAFVLFRALRLERTSAAVLAVVSSSLAFSLAHYAGTGGEAFDLFTFTFRVLAGVFFAVLFVTRGFGVAVGCHAAYDVMVGILFAGPAR